MNAAFSIRAIATTILICCWNGLSQDAPASFELRPIESPPVFGTFYLATGSAPFPFDPYFGQLPVYESKPGVYVVDDSQINSFGGQALGALNGGGGAMTLSDPLPDPCNGNCPTNGGGGGPIAYGGNYDHSSTDLWLEVTSVVMSNSLAYFVIHTPETNGVYDLFSTTNMAPSYVGLNQTNWVWILRTAAGQTNITLTNIWQWQGWFELGTMLDGDSDGITTAFETLVSHTSPSNADTDGDGILDGVEVQYALNPIVADPPFTISITQPTDPLLP